MRKIVLYIVYGDDQTYYDGAKFSFLTFMNWTFAEDSIEYVVLTEKPDEFLNYPVAVFSITEKQKKEWSLDGKYHFRIKNKGMSHVIRELELDDSDKILFFDTDTYFNKSPISLFNLINEKRALLYLNEGLIYSRKRFNIYIKSLENVPINIENEIYLLSRKSSMWGSLMVGLMPNMLSSLDWADKLMLQFYELVPAHTIEPFSLAESLSRKFEIVEGRKFVSLYSTSRKKEFCRSILKNFFLKYSDHTVDEQIKLAQKVKMKRPFLIVLKQRFFEN